MTHHTSIRHDSPRRRMRRARKDAAVETLPPSILEHPDGYYWVAEGELGEFGPFETYELAQADRDATSEEAIAPGAALRQAERAIGVAEWIDPETGEPAEGSAPPQLRE